MAQSPASSNDNDIMYVLQAVKSETTDWLDLKVTQMQTGETFKLSAVNSFEGASFFEAMLARDIGGFDAVHALYRKDAQFQVTRPALERICSAHASALCPY